MIKKNQVGFHKQYNGKMLPMFEEDGYRFVMSEYVDNLRLNILDYLPDDRWLAFLKRLREYVKSAPYFEDDCSESGHKHIHFSWGACCDDPKLWPDQKDLIFPKRELIMGKVDPLYRTENQLCPFDKRDKPWDIDKDGCVKGCHYTCRVFNRRRGNRKLDISFALELIDKRITETERRITTFVQSKDKKRTNLNHREP